MAEITKNCMTVQNVLTREDWRTTKVTLTPSQQKCSRTCIHPLKSILAWQSTVKGSNKSFEEPFLSVNMAMQWEWIWCAGYLSGYVPGRPEARDQHKVKCREMQIEGRLEAMKGREDSLLEGSSLWRRI